MLALPWVPFSMYQGLAHKIEWRMSLLLLEENQCDVPGVQSKDFSLVPLIWTE
jgi:hypothetical protein